MCHFIYKICMDLFFPLTSYGTSVILQHACDLCIPPYFLLLYLLFTIHVKYLCQIWTKSVVPRGIRYSYIYSVFIIYLCKHQLSLKDYLKYICPSDALSWTPKERSSSMLNPPTALYHSYITILLYLSL